VFHTYIIAKLRALYSLILFGIRKNCLTSGTSLFLKGDKTGCSNMLSTSCKILCNILLSRLGPYIDEIIVDQQCGFWRKRWTSEQTFCICQILEKNWEHSEPVHQLFVDLKKAYDSVKREYCKIFLYSLEYPWHYLGWFKMCFYNCWVFNNSVSVMSISLLVDRMVGGFCRTK
jgi:hypothetical protein